MAESRRSNKASKRKRVKKTVIIVGEGPTEKAFLEYLGQFYIKRNSGISVKIQAATGGSPECILSKTIKLEQYDSKAILMDTDKEWSPSLIKKAQQKKIKLIGSQPCIEGLILEILERNVPYESKNCKDSCSELFRGKLTNKETYKEQLSSEWIEQKRQDISTLNEILTLFTLHN